MSLTIIMYKQITRDLFSLKVDDQHMSLIIR